jgi:hypothetical protein
MSAECVMMTPKEFLARKSGCYIECRRKGTSN